MAFPVGARVRVSQAALQRPDACGYVCSAEEYAKAVGRPPMTTLGGEKAVHIRLDPGLYTPGSGYNAWPEGLVSLEYITAPCAECGKPAEPNDYLCEACRCSH